LQKKWFLKLEESISTTIYNPQKDLSCNCGLTLQLQTTLNNANHYNKMTYITNVGGR